MGSFSKQLLSASPNGLPIKITGTATGSANTIHTTGSSSKDVMWLHAINTTNGNVDLTIEFGGVVSPDHHIKMRIAANSGPVLIVPGVPLTGGVVVKAFASVANAINIVGYADRISEAVGGTLVQGGAFDTYSVEFTQTGGEHIDIGSPAELQFTQNDPFSVAYWFKGNGSLTSDGWVISDYSSGSNWRIYENTSSNRIYFSVYDGTTQITAQLDTSKFDSELRDEYWHLIIATFDGGGTSANIALMADGLERATASGSLVDTISGGNLQFGDKPPSYSPWRGFLGPVMIYNAALTETQAVELYNNGNNLDPRSGPAAANLVGYWRMGYEDSGTTIIDWSGNNNNGTMNGLTVADDVFPSVHFRAPYIYTPVSPGLKCIDFAGGDDEASNSTTMPKTQIISTTTPFAFCFWTKATTGGGYYVVLGDNHLSWVEGIWIRDMSSTQIQMEIGNGTGTRYTRGLVTLLTDEHRDGEWHHHFVRWDGTQFGLAYWMDGRRRIVSHSVNNNITDHIFSDIGQVYVGDGFTGKITELAVWNRWLSDAEIRQIYNAGQPVDPTILPENLLHYWPLGDGDEYPTLVDVINGHNLTMTNMDSGDIVTDHPANPV